MKIGKCLIYDKNPAEIILSKQTAETDNGELIKKTKVKIRIREIRNICSQKKEILNVGLDIV